MPKPIPIQRAQYVSFSAVMDELPKALELFNQGEYDFTWGSNNVTLEARRNLIDAFNNLDPDDETTKAEVDTAIERLKSFGSWEIGNEDPIIYVDMES